jgi:Sortase domain
MQQLLRATARRRLALVLLLVVGVGLLFPRTPDRADDAPAAPSAAPPAAVVASTADVPAAPAAPPPAAPAEFAGSAAPGLQYAPMGIRIPKIGVAAPVDPLGLNADGSLAVPTDFDRAGYYTGRPVPGATGPAIIVAHVDSRTGPAVFARLRDLKPGDEVTVTRTDHSDVIFVIDRVESHPKNAFPTNAVYDATPDATLRLITCGGSFDHATGHYRANTIAFAHFKALVPHTAGVA